MALGSQGRVARVVLGFLLCGLVAPASAQRVWVYTMVPADHGGDLLLPHFINHYHQLGITYRRFLVLVHHWAGRHPRAGLEKVSGICEGYFLECRIWEGEYSPDAHYERQLRMLSDFVLDPYDWVVIANSDELQQWPGNIKEELDRIAQEARDAGETPVSHLDGQIIDRLAPKGQIVPISQVSDRSVAQSLFRQFPLTCRPLRHQGKPPPDPDDDMPTTFDETLYAVEPHTQVVAFRNSFRPGRSWRRMVSPDKAEAYFGACSPGRKCLRGTLNGTAADLFSLTPYAKERDWYRYSWTPQDVKAVPGHGLFRLRKWPRLVVPVHRFQWHDGGVARLKDELERYRGTCTVDGTAESEESCTALIPQWKEMAALYRSAAVSGRVDVVGAGCDSVPAEDDVQENTAYMGLAWEEFDESLGVVSKVRNTVKGDSQTRMASLAAGGEDEEA